MNAIPIQPPFYYRRPIRWGDADVAGIVFTAHYFDICMEAIESWFIEVLELDWFTMIQEHGIGSPFVHAGIDFHAPLTPRDCLSIQVDIERIGNSSLSLTLIGRRQSDEQHSFTGSFICCFSEIKDLKNITIPEWLRQRVEHYQQRRTT